MIIIILICIIIFFTFFGVKIGIHNPKGLDKLKDKRNGYGDNWGDEN